MSINEVLTYIFINIDEVGKHTRIVRNKNKTADLKIGFEETNLWLNGIALPQMK